MLKCGMKLTLEQYERIAEHFPKARGTLVYSNLEAVNAILYIAENGAKWRRLPEKFGNWHTLYSRMRAWAKSGVLARVFRALQQEQIIRIKIEAASLDSTSIKVHPDGCGAQKKTVSNQSDVPEEDSQPRFIWLPEMSGQPFASRSRPDKPPTDRRGASC